MAEPLKVCIDRVLPAQTMRLQSTVRRDGATRALIPVGKTWMNGTTLRVRFIGGTAAQRARAKQQAEWWTAHANLRFEFGEAADAEIRVTFDSSDGAWSYVGTDNRAIPLDQPTMNLGFLDGGTAGHEFGHAIGLAHEHQNPAGGIEWNETRVIADLSGPPNHWDEATIRHNVLRKYAVNQIQGTHFDAESIMLYFFPGSWTQSGIGTEANEVLSNLDKAFIASAQAYPRDAPTAEDAVVVKVGASRRTQARIGNAGEEDLFTFTVERGARHTIDTRGPTDVVMKLFGPDGRTNLIAEDDDSGVGTNARLTVDLIAGTYLVQIRHYDRSRGKGDYSLGVRKAS
ncbi:MAG: M12 family metallopeptidase [Dokdonella sp.]